jgi:hypothetical protein
MFRYKWVAFAAASLIVLGHAAGNASGQPDDPSDDQSVSLADRVEEDWVLVVDGTASGDGPQINTVMSPSGNLFPLAFSLGVNYRTSPSFASGGLQVLVYSQYGLTSSSNVASSPLNPNETVTWTQRMRLADGKARFSIPALTSTAWGNYSSDAELATYPVSLNSLSLYDPDTSATSSGAAWKTTGVTSLTLVRVRYYLGSTLIATDNNPRTVDCTKSFTKP